jgi:hypothetical protein
MVKMRKNGHWGPQMIPFRGGGTRDLPVWPGGPVHPCIKVLPRHPLPFLNGFAPRWEPPCIRSNRIFAAIQAQKSRANVEYCTALDSRKGFSGCNNCNMDLSSACTILGTLTVRVPTLYRARHPECASLCLSRFPCV